MVLIVKWSGHFFTKLEILGDIHKILISQIWFVFCLYNFKPGQLVY